LLQLQVDIRRQAGQGVGKPFADAFRAGQFLRQQQAFVDPRTGAKDSVSRRWD